MGVLSYLCTVTAVPRKGLSLCTADDVFLFFLFRGNDARLELEEYQENSREVEAELEAQLKQAEAQVRDLRSNNNRLHFEHNSIKVRIFIHTKFPLCLTQHEYFSGSGNPFGRYGTSQRIIKKMSLLHSYCRKSLKL